MKSIVKQPLPAHVRYIRLRSEECKGIFKITSSELTDLMTDEWRNLTEEDKEPYLLAAKEEREVFKQNWTEIEAVGVDSYMKTIKEKRQENEVDDEYQEDDILAIVNHKRKWKKTWGKKKMHETKINRGYLGNGRKRIKLKLN